MKLSSTTKTEIMTMNIELSFEELHKLHCVCTRDMHYHRIIVNSLTNACESDRITENERTAFREEAEACNQLVAEVYELSEKLRLQLIKSIEP